MKANTKVVKVSSANYYTGWFSQLLADAVIESRRKGNTVLANYFQRLIQTAEVSKGGDKAA